MGALWVNIFERLTSDNKWVEQKCTDVRMCICLREKAVDMSNSAVELHSVRE